MALGDFFQAFNPMDVVTGYERGTRLGIEREKGEEEIQRQRQLNQIVKLQNIPAAELSGMDTAAKIAAIRGEPGVLEGTYGARIKTEAGQATRALSEEQLFGATLEDRLAQKERLMREGYSEEATEQLLQQQEATRRSVAAGAQVSAGGQEATLADQKSRGEALTLFQQQVDIERTATDRDPTAPRTDTWHKINESIKQATTPNTRRLLQLERDEEALRGIGRAAQAGDIPQMELYMQRYGRPNTKIEIVDAVINGQAIKLWQLSETQAGPDGKPMKIPGQRFSADANSANYIARLLPGILGLGTSQLPPARAPVQQRQGTVSAPQGAAPKPGEVSPAAGANIAAGATNTATDTLAVTRPQQDVQAQRSAAPPSTPASMESAMSPEQQLQLDAAMTAGPGAADLTIREQQARQAAALEERRQALSRTFEALSREEQLQVGAASRHAQRLQDLLGTPGGNTEANRTLLAFYSRRVEEMLGRGQQRGGRPEARGVVQQPGA